MMQLHHGDCLEVLRGLPDASVDAVIADPPYGTTACKWDSVIPFAPMWEQLRRVTKPRAAIVLFASQPFTSALTMSNLREFRYSWVWDKRLSGNPFLAKYQPLKRHEDICVFSQRPTQYRPQMTSGKLRAKGGGRSKLFGVDCTRQVNDTYYPTSIVEFSNAVRGEHPTQKPVDLLAYLVRTYTNPDETVLDFCMGSGTTGVACVQEGRHFIGVEREPAYFAIAKRRIATAQPPLPIAEGATA